MNVANDYRTGIVPTWCPGCPNFLVFAQIQQVLAEKKIQPYQLVFCYDIGCSGNLADFLKCFGFHTLHGRAVAVASGIKRVKPDLTVAVYGGDGGIYGEGLNHTLAAARANIGIKVLVANNFLYSLTTGQTSPTTPFQAKTKSTPLGNPNKPIDPVKLIKAANTDVWAKTVSATDHAALKTAIGDLFDQPGFALLDISQNCLAFGKQLLP